MDRLNQLRGEAGGSRDSTLDTSSPPSEAFMTANESSSKYFSLSEVDSTFDISPIKDISLASATVQSEKTITESDQLISNLSPIGKKSDFDTYKIGKQIEAANILSGGVEIFDDNDNSYDGNELVIDDNAEIEEKSNPELKLADSQFKDENSTEATLVETEAVPSKDTEVILQIDGKNVDAIDIGNGLYLYRKDGQEELAAVQIIDDEQQQTSFKFLKVRENNEGNLEVYEEIQIEVPKEVPVKEEKVVDKNVSHVPIMDISKVISDSTSNKIAERKIKTQNIPKPVAPVVKETVPESKKEDQSECKPDNNVSKKMKFSESRKSPVIGSFTPMTFHSTPNKEGIPLTKTMVDQQLHPNRHSDNVKKTIEVHTDSVKQRILESPCKQTKDSSPDKVKEPIIEKDIGDKSIVVPMIQDNKDAEKEIVSNDVQIDDDNIEEEKLVIDESVDKVDQAICATTTPNEDHAPVDEKSKDLALCDSTQNMDNKDEVDGAVTKDIKISEEPKVKEIELLSKDNSSVVSETKSTLTINQVIDENISVVKEDSEKPVLNKIIEPDLQIKEVENKQPAKSELTLVEESANITNNESVEKPNLQEPEKQNPKPVVLSNTDTTKIDSTTVSSLNDTPVVKSVIDVSDNKSLECREISLDNKIIVKETEPKMKPDSTDDSKNQKLEEPVVVMEVDTSNNAENIETSPNVPNPKEKDIVAVQTETEPTKVPEIIKTPEKVLESNKTDNKEKHTDAESKPKKSNDTVPDKPKSILKKDIKNTIPETADNKKQNADFAKTTSATITSHIAVPVPPTKAPKINIPNTKDKQNHEIKKPDIKPLIKQQDIKPSVTQPKNDLADKKVAPKITINTDQKPINNNHAPVPFGKWTDVNRQAFLNKIKESKVPTNSSNGKQIKNSNDLNRRDVLKKIDSQRQAQELANMNRLGVKKETAFTNKPSAPQDNKSAVKTEIPILKNNTAAAKKITKPEPVAKPQTVTTTTLVTAVKKETTQRKEINNQDLIDKTIEEIINRPVPAKNSQEDGNPTATKELPNVPKSKDSQLQPQADKPITQTSLDAIEMKMNELHGIPFIERPAHELPYVQKPAPKSFPKPEPQKAPIPKPSNIPNLLPFVSKAQKGVKENIIEVDSEEEVIEHEPITGDMDIIKQDTAKLLIPDTNPLMETMTLISADSSKKETIITEKDFDKFVRRNSINYEKCLTVNFDINEPHHNLVQTIVQNQKESAFTAYTKPESIHTDAKLLSPRKHEQFTQNSLSKPVQNMTKFGNLVGEDDCNKNYQSKVKMAYQTAMTAKRQLERPITIIEDRPVKVVYMDTNAEYIPPQPNAQGQDLSPSKKPINDIITTQISDSLDSDTLDSIDEGKVLDESKVKTKHQRKQVLTPVETPELELIGPDDLGIEVSPKKKRRTEEKVEKSVKTLVPKKSYLLGRGNTPGDSITKPFDLSKNSQAESTKQDAPVVPHKNTASAIDSLVKAAELLETQSASISSKSPDVPTTPDSQQNTPVKRGRGRPRKYPLPEGASDKTKVPSPQKKPRLIDAKVVKNKDSDDDDDSTDDEMVKENWTMGKINENIVCPICNKLFRSENVVFKHVKHCTGPSPSRSDSDNKSPRRLRDSQESETKSVESKSDMDIDETITPQKDVRKKRKSKDATSKISGNKDDVIVIEDTPIKPKVDRREESKPPESRKTLSKNKVPDKANSLVCEICGKTFRLPSYLVNHISQHDKNEIKKQEDAKTKTVFSCETCKKDYRKLHHLVQHRNIHNPSTSNARPTRKSSSEQNNEAKTSKDQNPAKQGDDQSTGFRCEPCDKSFRKLHHLVEHRETHDGINRQKTTSTSAQASTEKPTLPPQCDICKKTFRKLHHLIEHKEQHLETSSEKSDDKSVKSSLSTKDIIHECSLCYMVFPNEHSLNKHTVICQRKKRQSATKQLKQAEEGEKSEGDKELTKTEENKPEKDDDVTIVSEEFPVEHKPEQQEKANVIVEPKIEDKRPAEEISTKSTEPIPVQNKESLKSADVTEKPESVNVIKIVEPKPKVEEELPRLPIKMKKTDDKEPKPKVQETPRKKIPQKEKVAPTITKRHKPNVPVPVTDDAKPAESSDDDEIRYMLNPDYKFQDNEGKLFMKVRANKRNSLQIERPNSKDLVKRRISLQHPPKVPRLKPKLVQKPVSSTGNSSRNIVKAPKLEPVPSTDSDDSDVKYSFPEPPADDVPKPSKNPPETTSKEPVKKAQRKSIVEKRKSLSSIAKRKSLGKAVGVKHKVKASPLKQIRKRTAEVEHRCDCGQLFSSAALLSRHTTLAHTPPRIRRRRSPPPEVSAKTVAKPAPRKPPVPAKTKPSADSRKSSVKSDNPNPKPNQPSTKRKSSINKTEPKTPNENRKSPKSSDKTESVKSATSNVKLRRYAAHKGVPVPEKMRKLMEKSKK